MNALDPWGSLDKNLSTGPFCYKLDMMICLASPFFSLA